MPVPEKPPTPDPTVAWNKAQGYLDKLFDALHDYFVEMFIRTPQDRADRRERGL